MAIIILCSHLCADDTVKPFAPAQWTKLTEMLTARKIEPFELLSFSSGDFKAKLDLSLFETQRITKLVERSGSIALEIDKYANMGIKIMTRADAHYPRALLKKLGRTCPPILYYAGNPALAGSKCAGFVGSRSIGLSDEVFTAATVSKVNAKGFSVVSGGARGIDKVASDVSLANGCCSVEYVPASLSSRVRPGTVASAILDNRLLVLSAVKPDSEFLAGFAVMRNKYIYAQSEGTVIVKSDYGKGGTWNGAVANMNRQLCGTFCWNNPEYAGNLELIRQGAIPIDKSWDGDVERYKPVQPAPPEQFSLFS